MTVRVLDSEPTVSLSELLGAFERQFEYPLGADNQFHISHGMDYTRFFRAIGDPACFLAERDGTVEGVIGAAIRDLILPDGSVRRVAYFCDLKLSANARSGRSLLHLMTAARSWAEGRCGAAISVVMDGTEKTPTRYTGRVGIPLFAPLARVMVFRAIVSARGEAAAIRAAPADVDLCYRRLTVGSFATPCGSVDVRSEIEPYGLVLPDGSACGLLEDTRRAKRLIDSSGMELRSTHLSCFGYASPEAAARLVQAALQRSADGGFPAMFFAVPRPEAAAIREALGKMEVVLAPATIYGCGVAGGNRWYINTSEI